jgi:hypothetical protein
VPAARLVLAWPPGTCSISSRRTVPFTVSTRNLFAAQADLFLYRGSRRLLRLDAVITALLPHRDGLAMGFVDADVSYTKFLLEDQPTILPSPT